MLLNYDEVPGKKGIIFPVWLQTVLLLQQQSGSWYHMKLAMFLCFLLTDDYLQ